MAMDIRNPYFPALPQGWYYSVTLTGASFGTITQIQM